MRPIDRLAAESERLRQRVEALERLAAENRQAEEARRRHEEQTQQPRVFTELDEASVQRLADRAGLAIQNARQLRGHVRRQDELTVLYEVIRMFTSPLPAEALVEAVHPILGRLLDVRRMLALRWIPATGTFELVWASAPGWSPADAELEALVLRRNQTIRTADYLATCQAEGVTPSAFAHGRRYAALVPMSLADRAAAVLALWSADRVFSRADEELLTTVAALGALRLTR